MDSHEAITRLEARLTHLERHIEEQDREIYRQAEQISLLRRALEAQRDRVQSLEDGGAAPGHERPPHY